jgi:paraquat-inducible protein B
LLFDGELHVSGTTNFDSVVVDSSLAVDGAFSIQNGTYSILDNQFHFLSSIDGDLKTTQNTMTARLDGHDNDVQTLTTVVAAHSASLTSHTDVLYMHDITLESHVAQLAALDTLTGQHTTYIAAHTASLTTQAAAIQTAHDGVDLNLSAIATKQNQLSASNRLNAAYIGDGSITTPELATTTTTIQSQINAINNTLPNLDIDVTTLEQLQNMDLAQFSTVQWVLRLLHYKASIPHTTQPFCKTLPTLGICKRIRPNTGRLNVYDSLTLDTRVTTNTSDIASVTFDLSTVQTTLSGVQSTLDTKQDTIDATHKLASNLVTTNVSASASTLDVILQSLTDINATQSTTLTDINSTVISLQSQIDMNDGELLIVYKTLMWHTIHKSPRFKEILQHFKRGWLPNNPSSTVATNSMRQWCKTLFETWHRSW